VIASLPMYDRAETADAHDRLWGLIRNALGRGPASLTRNTDVWDIWHDPALCLSQTCGYPYRAKLHGAVTLIGTPDHGLAGCAPGYYQSVFVTRKDQPGHLHQYRDARFAFNEAMSQSGWAAAQTHAAQLGFQFSNTVQTGAHRESARAVAEGRADVAALDAVSWAMMQAYDDFASTLHVVDRTTPTPALPYICAPGADGREMFNAIGAAIGDLSARDRATLHLKGIVQVPARAYLEIPNPPAP